MTNNSIPTLFDPEVQLCPFAAYKKMRDAAPVFHEPETGFYILTRYDDVKAAAIDWQNFSNSTQVYNTGSEGSPGQAEVLKILDEDGYRVVDALVTADPPRHRFHRAAVNLAFSSPRVRAMEDYIRDLTNELIDSMAPKGTVDFVTEFAIRLPMLVIADQLGVPRAMEKTFKHWSDAMIINGNVGNPPEVQIQAARDIVDMQNFFAAEFDKLIAQPRDTILNDIARAADDEGKLLPIEERIATATQVLSAGNETTTSALGSAMLRMIEAPGMEERLRANPGLIGNFVEEVLRLEVPLQMLMRRATRDISINGRTIPKGALVSLRWAAGNRDERMFPNPDELDVERTNARSHLTFGQGIHFCVGRELARSELRTAIELLLKRLRNFRLAGPKEQATARSPSYYAYGLHKLEIMFDVIPA